MRALIERALEATGKAQQLLEALEANPSRLALLNGFVMFEELLKAELERCRGYSKKALELSLGGLIDLARKEFAAACDAESWKLLGNLARLKDCAALWRSCRMPLDDIVPQALRLRLTPEALSAPCMRFLEPRLSGLWKFLTQFTYLQVYCSIQSAAAQRGEELGQDLRKLRELLAEYLSGPEGDELLAQIEAGPESQQAG